MILSFPLRPVQVGSDGIVDGTANDESIAPQTMVGTCTTLSLRTYASRLRERLGPVVHLCITDCSDGHTRAGYLDGRALDPNGMELKVLIVSRAFVDMPPLERQRIVNGLLEVDIVTGMWQNPQPAAAVLDTRAVGKQGQAANLWQFARETTHAMLADRISRQHC